MSTKVIGPGRAGTAVLILWMAIKFQSATASAFALVGVTNSIATIATAGKLRSLNFITAPFLSVLLFKYVLRQTAALARVPFCPARAARPTMRLIEALNRAGER